MFSPTHCFHSKWPHFVMMLKEEGICHLLLILKQLWKEKKKLRERRERFDYIISICCRNACWDYFSWFCFKNYNHLIAACISWGGKKLVAWCNIKITAEDFFNFIHSSYFLCVRILFLYFLNVSVCLFFVLIQIKTKFS